MDERQPAGFVQGVFTGYAGLVVLAQLILVVAFPDMRGMYRDFGSDIQLPLLTRITIHPAWSWTMPVVGILTVVGLLARRPRSLVPYIIAAVVLTAIAVVTWWYPRAPIYALAANIKAD